MKDNFKKIFTIIIILLLAIFIGTSCCVHSGRTDANGGHRNNKNKSGLGSYHYHCGGHPAHLHTNGVCPYASSSGKTTSSSTSSNTKNSQDTSSKNKTKVLKKSENIMATEIKIDENIQGMNIGESKSLIATIYPTNTTNKKVDWKSSDENIATIDTTGKITAKGLGTVTITATTNNGIKKTTEILVKEKVQKESNNMNNDTNKIKGSNTNICGIIIVLGGLGGLGYLIYIKNIKKV